MHDLGARLFRRPGETADGLAVRVVEIEDEIADGQRVLIELAQIGQSQLRGNARERPVVDEFYRHENRRNAVDRRRYTVTRTDRDSRDHRRAVHQPADHRRLPVRAAVGRIHLVETDRALRRLVAAAHEVDHRDEAGTGGRKPFRVGGAVIDQRIDQPVIAIENKDVVVVEIGFQPRSDALIDPIVIERTANVLDRTVRGGDALRFAQYALPVIAERAREHLLFVVDGNHVGALGRGQNGDDDANDRDGDNDADRDNHAQPSAVPTGVLPRVGSAGTSQSRHELSPLKRPAHWLFQAGR